MSLLVVRGPEETFMSMRWEEGKKIPSMWTFSISRAHSYDAQSKTHLWRSKRSTKSPVQTLCVYSLLNELQQAWLMKLQHTNHYMWQQWISSLFSCIDKRDINAVQDRFSLKRWILFEQPKLISRTALASCLRHLDYHMTVPPEALQSTEDEEE